MNPPSQTLLELVRGILGDLDLDTVLIRVLEASRELTGARFAALGVLDSTREHLDRFLTVGIDEQTRQRIGPLPTGRGVLGELISHPSPLRLTDVGSHPHSYGFPVNHPPMHAFLGVPVLIADVPYGNLYLTEKADGTEFTAAEETAIVQLAAYAAVAIEHARRYAGVERERAALAQTVDALQATTDITRALAGENQLDVILETIAERGRALVGATSLLIELIDQRELVLAAAAGAVPADMFGRRLQLEDTVAGAAIRTRETQRLSEPLNHDRFSQYGAGQLGLDPNDGLVVPMIFRGEVRGALVALDREDGLPFTGAQQRLLESFADSAAMAVGTAQSAADERRRRGIAAAEVERARWARELHDDTLQSLAGLRLGLASARRTADPTRLQEAVDTALDELQAGIESLRALIADVRPGALDELGIEAALEDLARRFEHRGVEVALSTELEHERGREPNRLAPELETAIYRTVQEALNNVIKHSGATRASVDLADAGGTVRLSVRDNGRGFNPSTRQDGFGLVGMRERANLAGGVLKVSSEPGAGAEITAEFPVTRLGSAGGSSIRPR